MAQFYDMLVYLRKRAKLSQQQLADALGMTRSAISMYETNQREPDLETLEIFADFFNVDMNTLVGGAERIPAAKGARPLSDAELKFALWGSDDIDDEDLEDVRRYAAFVKERKKGKK